MQKSNTSYLIFSCLHILLHVEVKIYSRTDIFSDPRLQRSKCGNNSARSSEQQDMQALGWFTIPGTIVVCGNNKSRLKIHCKTTPNFLPTPPERKDNSSCPSIGFIYEPIPCCSSYGYQTCPLVENRCLNGCNVSFAESWVEDFLELNFRYVDYQTLAHLSYSSCVCWISVRATRAQRFLSVRVSINASTSQFSAQEHGHIFGGSKIDKVVVLRLGMYYMFSLHDIRSVYAGGQALSMQVSTVS